MSTNPYESPKWTEANAPTDPGRTKLRQVATYQRRVILALIANIVVNVVSLGVREAGLAVMVLVVVAALAVAIFAIVAMYGLASVLMNKGLGILCAALMLIPCVSLITLLVVNQKASSYLQKHGVRVGFFGANPDSV